MIKNIFLFLKIFMPVMRNVNETIGVEKLEGILDVGYKFEKDK